MLCYDVIFWSVTPLLLLENDSLLAAGLLARYNHYYHWELCSAKRNVMRVVYLGSPEEATIPLKYLHAASQQFGIQIVGVVSQPARESGRGRQLVDPPVARLAKELNIPTLQPEKASHPDFLASFRAWSPDIAITCAFGQILSDNFLSCPKRATINIHPSLLPAYRGATPVQTALLQGETTTGVTILFTVKKLDAGAIILQKSFAVLPRENAGQLMTRLFAESGPLLMEALKKLEDPAFSGTPQDELRVTTCRKIAKQDGLINWNESPVAILNKFRAFTPWPGSFTFMDDKRLVIEEMSLAPETPALAPGQFTLSNDKSSLLVSTAAGAIAILRIKKEGKASQLAKDFWNGVRHQRCQFTTQNF